MAGSETETKILGNKRPKDTVHGSLLRFFYKKVYSPKIVELEDLLLQAGRERKFSDLQDLLLKLGASFTHIGKKGTKRVDRKYRQAFDLALQTTKTKLKQAADGGKVEDFLEESKIYQNILRKYEPSFGSRDKLEFMTPGAYSLLERKCIFNNLSLRLEKARGKLKQYYDQVEGETIASLEMEPPDYQGLQEEINYLKQTVFELKMGELAGLDKFEEDLQVFKLLNHEFRELYELAQESQDTLKVWKRFQDLKPGLKGYYKEEVMNRTYRKIFDSIDPAGKS